MPKKVEMFKTEDGRFFESLEIAKAHKRNLAVFRATERMGMSELQIAVALENLSNVNENVKLMLNSGHTDWRNWSISLIEQITPDLFNELQSKPTQDVLKETQYIYCGAGSEQEIVAMERGESFADIYKYSGDGHKVLKVVESGNSRKVFLGDKLNREERIAEKIKRKESLTEEESLILLEAILGL